MKNDNSTQSVENISVNLNEDAVREIVDHEYAFKVDKIQKQDGYDDLNFYLTPSEGTALIEQWPHGFLIKIINSKDSREEDFFNEYISVLLHLKNEGISCPCPIKNKKGKYLSHWIDKNRNIQCNKGELKTRKHIILLLTYIPGETIDKVGDSDKIIFSLGHFLSQLHVQLRPFSNSEVLHRPNFTWSLMFVPKIVNLLDFVENEKRLLVSQIVEQFEKRVLSNLDSLEKGLIHGDVNYGNVLVKKRTSGGDDFAISGIIDFTDMHIAYYLFDVSLAACYISLSNIDRYEDVVALFLLGYQRQRQITNLEFLLLKVCMCARLCQSIVLGLQALITNPENEYVKNSTSMKYGWKLMNKLSKISDKEFVDVLMQKMSYFRSKVFIFES